MCHYQTELWRHRRAVADERPRDTVSSELDGLVEAWRPARTRPLLEPFAGFVQAAFTHARRLLGRPGAESRVAGARLRPGMH